LTRRVKEHWKQNDHLRLAVKIEARPEPAPNGQPAMKRYLQFRVEDSRHDFSNRLDRRSTGFQWFVSFLASFLEFEADTNLILLLDEPGLSLHARAQMDLLNTIESKLAVGRQVLYSTHSPFLVQTSRLNEVRIVEDQGPDLGSVVIQDAGVVTDSDTLFPLQAALGYDIAQSLFIGNRNILVEGISDFIYLTVISDHLASIGRSFIPADARILPAGGATNIPTFIALLGGQLDVVVLVDGGTSRQRIEDSITRGRLDAARVISLDSFATAPKPDIEDLFTPSEYLVFYNEAFNTSLTVADLTGKDRIVDRIGRVAGGEFNHGVVGASFLRNLDRSIKSLSPGSLDRFESVIMALTKALPPAR
jgi:predicted ATP-dependent endonuclease of OLD family